MTLTLGDVSELEIVSELYARATMTLIASCANRTYDEWLENKRAI